MIEQAVEHLGVGFVPFALADHFAVPFETVGFQGAQDGVLLGRPSELHQGIGTQLGQIAVGARLDELAHGAPVATGAVRRFVDEVSHLFRSQIAAILGNIGLVVPVVLLISSVLAFTTGSAMVDEEKAHHTLESISLLGPTLLFAAFTGVLLFASSIVAGWVENWFVLHKLDSAIGYNPAITRRLGAVRAQRWGRFLRTHISGLTANISLGLMLGLVPAVAGFFGLGADVRHVTLVMGQMAAAVATLGLGVLLEGGFWSAVLATLLVGPINLAVSFYLAFRLALKAQGVSDVNRQRIQAALRHRLRRAEAVLGRPLDDPSVRADLWFALSAVLPARR